MKKWGKVSLKIMVGLLLLLALIFLFATATIDTTPYFETTYYHNTIAKMEVAAKNKIESKGPLLAGFAKVNITPTIVEKNPNSEKGEFSGIKLAGYGDGKLAKGVHDSIYAKAIALEVRQKEVVIISADLLLMPEPIVLAVAEKLKGIIARDQLLFGATHTHSSIGNCLPSYVGESFGGEYQPEMVAWLSDKIVTLIKKALADKQPAQFSSGDIRVPNLVKNRIIGESGRLNDRLDVLSFKQDSGKSATIGVYSAHATVIGTFNDEFSGDYPGYFQRHLEANGTDYALFFAGTVGSHSNKGEGEKFEKAKYIGEALADSAQVILHGLEYHADLQLSTINTELEIPKLQFFKISDRLRLSPFLGKQLMPKIASIPLQGLKLNQLVWITLPYELSGEYGLDLKNAMKTANHQLVLSSFNGQYLGYIIPTKYYYFDTYEAALMGWYGPSMGDYLMELNFKMANALIHTNL
ncbi:MAG: neutral/alkaline non-lysosomal ceramidase N-terminal domain-containing protein [Arenibacter latericius]|nr:neutral/alkaline non-lysosomal ceramidase N-terminal domain-containing protein [Arenibacter latericius]